MSNTVKTILGIIALIIIILLVRGISGDKTTTPEGPIKIGFIGPLSGDGAPYGEPSRNGAMVAVYAINAAGGINGQQVELIVEDGKCNGKDALNAAQKLVNVDKVQFIVGGACSGETLGFTSFAEQNKILVFSYGSSSPDITKSGDYIFRNAPSDALGGAELAKLVIAKGATKIAVVSENTDFAKGVESILKQNLSSDQIVSTESFNTGNSDFRTIALKVKSSNADAVVLNVQSGASGARLAKQLREAGVTGQFFTFFVSGDDFVKSGEAVENTYVLDVPSLSKNKMTDEFVAAYESKYGKIPSYIVFGGGAYDAVSVIAEGVKKYGYSATKVKDFLYTVKDRETLIGKYSIDSNGDSVGIGYTVKQIKGQKLVDVE